MRQNVREHSNLHVDTYCIEKYVGVTSVYENLQKFTLDGRFRHIAQRKGIHSVTADNMAAGASDSKMEAKCEVFRQLCRLIGRERGDRRQVGSIRSDFSVEAMV